MADGQTDFRAGSEEAWEKFRDQRTKPKAAPNEEFQAACSLWQMQFAFHSFLALRAGIDFLLERKVHSDQPEYYPMSVGLICLYARPFTNNHPVGPLAEDIIPPNEVNLHRLIVAMRHQLFAHMDASAMAKADDYPNELIFENNAKGTRFGIAPLLIEPEFFKLMRPLVDQLIEKTGYHKDKLAKKFNRYFSQSKNIGEYRLNVLDPAAPIFSRLTDAEKKTRETTIRPRNPSA